MTVKNEKTECTAQSPVEDPILAASRERRAEQAEANMESVRAAQARLAPLLAEGRAAAAIKARWEAEHAATHHARRAELAAVPQDGSKLAWLAYSLLERFAAFEQQLHNIDNVERATAIIASLTPSDFPATPDAGFLGNRSGSAKLMLTNAVASGAGLGDAWRGLEEAWQRWGAAVTGVPATPMPPPLPEMPDPGRPVQTHAITSRRHEEED